jgi:hypothetical protein
MSNNFQSLQEAVRTCLDYWKAGKTDSLIDFTKPTRVEPICIVDAAVIHNAMLPEVMQSLLSIYTGYYLQAISVMATVGKVQVLKQLDRLNPERDLLENAANSNFFTMVKENYSDRLPMPLKSTAMEAQGADVKKMQAEMDEMRKKLEAQGKAPPIGITKDSIATAKELSNLSVGKLINVEIQDGGNKQSIAVNVRLITSSVPTKTLIHILTLDGEDKSWNDRMRGFMSGRLKWIKDGIFCQDLIDAHRKNLIADKDGAYTAISHDCLRWRSKHRHGVEHRRDDRSHRTRTRAVDGGSSERLPSPRETPASDHGDAHGCDRSDVRSRDDLPPRYRSTDRCRPARPEGVQQGHRPRRR